MDWSIQTSAHVCLHHVRQAAMRMQPQSSAPTRKTVRTVCKIRCRLGSKAQRQGPQPQPGGTSFQTPAGRSPSGLNVTFLMLFTDNFIVCRRRGLELPDGAPCPHSRWQHAAVAVAFQVAQAADIRLDAGQRAAYREPNLTGRGSFFCLISRSVSILSFFTWRSASSNCPAASAMSNSSGVSSVMRPSVAARNS